MGKDSAISWTDDTFNPWIGCTKVSPACDGCYAENWAKRYRPDITWGQPGERGQAHRTKNWGKVRRWDREQAAKVRAWEAGDPGFPQVLPVHRGPSAGPRPAPRFVFCASLSDVFDNNIPVEWRRELFDLIRETPHLTYLLLTKRPGNIVRMAAEALGLENDALGEAMVTAWPRNAAIGCTVVTQEEADRDIPKLLAAKAALNPAFAFVSMEPLLGPVDLMTYPEAMYPGGPRMCCGGYECGCMGQPIEPPMLYGLDWVITGGETDQGKHKARPSHPDWFRSLRDQCAAAGVAYQHKQNGEWREAQVGDEFDTSRGNAGKPPAFIVDPDDGTVHCFLPSRPNTRYRAMLKVGKKAAGRLLDGVEHNGRPEVRHA